MKNLLPKEAYHKDETGYWRRMPIVAGVLFGLSMAFASYSILGNTANLLHPRTPGEIILIGAVSALLFGILFPSMFRPRFNRVIDRVYSGDERLVPAPEGRFAFRLPCTWINGSLGIGGVLYFAKNGLLFVPHKLDRSPAQPFRLAPIDGMKVDLAPARPLTPLQRLLVPNPQPLIEIRAGSESAHFLVPSAINTRNLLMATINNLSEPSSSPESPQNGG